MMSLKQLITESLGYKQEQQFNQAETEQQKAELQQRIEDNPEVMSRNALLNNATNRGKAFPRIVQYKFSEDKEGIPLCGDAIFTDLQQGQVILAGMSAEDNEANILELAKSLEGKKKEEYTKFLERLVGLVRPLLIEQEASVRASLHIEWEITKEWVARKEEARNVHKVNFTKKNKKKKR